MAWLLNREEKQDYVIRLYKEGKSIRGIAELVHMSFRDIGAITNKVNFKQTVKEDISTMNLI
jgi:hypothetical protein